ncbi:MAG: hypothetical protein ACREF3_16630, partial [Acetobacteraceae bacterium]
RKPYRGAVPLTGGGGFFTHPIRAYFLPYGSGSTRSGNLGVGADFFFTPTLNGCTFAASDNGVAPTVAHSNYVDASTKIDQPRIGQDLNGIFGTARPAVCLVKTDYKRPTTGSKDYRVTVVGFRSPAGWRFFYQQYRVKEGKAHRPLNTCVELV